MRIIPAVLTNNLEDFNHQIELITEFTDEVDIDVLDMTFVPTQTVPIKDIVAAGSLCYHFDLMVKDPIEHINQIIAVKQSTKMNVGRVFVHIESTYDIHKLVEICTQQNFSLGFSLLLETASETFIDIFHQIQKIKPDLPVNLSLKTIQIGKQGNPYHPEALAKIAQVRNLGYTGDIYLDGGIDPDIIFAIRELDIAGVSVGSYISHSSDPMRSFNNLRSALWKKNTD